MSLQERIESLKAKHHTLEELIDVEHARPSPDDMQINRLKKEKLMIKDEIVTLTHQA